MNSNFVAADVEKLALLKAHEGLLIGLGTTADSALAGWHWAPLALLRHALEWEFCPLGDVAQRLRAEEGLSGGEIARVVQVGEVSKTIGLLVAEGRVPVEDARKLHILAGLRWAKQGVRQTAAWGPLRMEVFRQAGRWNWEVIAETVLDEDPAATEFDAKLEALKCAMHWSRSR